MHSKKLIEELQYLGISISYNRVMQIENDTAHSVCSQYQANDVVCPSQLWQGLFVVGAVDIDHDPSSTTSRSSFHGMGISITQFPTANNLGVEIEPVATVASQQISLPPSYSIVPAVALNQSKAEVPQKTCSDALRFRYSVLPTICCCCQLISCVVYLITMWSVVM